VTAAKIWPWAKNRSCSTSLSSPFFRVRTMRWSILLDGSLMIGLKNFLSQLLTSSAVRVTYIAGISSSTSA
jgi:hypothetical protein